MNTANRPARSVQCLGLLAALPLLIASQPAGAPAAGAGAAPAQDAFALGASRAAAPRESPSAEAVEGWTSASRPEFYFRTNGSAPPMYALFLLSVVLFLIGAGRLLLRVAAGRSPAELWRCRAGREPGPTPAAKSVVDSGLRRNDERQAPERSAGPEAQQPARPRLLRTLRLTFLQDRIRARSASGWLHLSIFWGILVLASGSLTILIDTYLLQPRGIRLARGVPYQLFQGALDLFGLVLIAGILIALCRRIWSQPESTRRGRRSVLILAALLFLSCSGFVLEALRIRMERGAEPWAFVGGLLATFLPATLESAGGGLQLYQLVWWCHVVVAFGLLAAIPYTPLRHVLTAPLNILLSSSIAEPYGKLRTPFDLKRLMQESRFDVKVGADSIADLGWRRRLALLACADFGGCQDVCPAHATGTALSPMRLIERLRQETAAGGRDHRAAADLFDRVVSPDEVWACTLCGACTQACPALVDPLSVIVELRRGRVQRQKLSPDQNQLLASLSASGNPYGLPRNERAELPRQLGVAPLSRQPEVEVLYWIGCSSSFDPRARQIASATVKILNAAGVRCAVLASEESCCGDPARRLGEEGLFQQLAYQNIETFERYKVRKLLTHCAHCFNTFRNEYPDFGSRLEVVHHSTMIADLIAAGRIELSPGPARRVTLHDACYLARFNRSSAAPRRILESVPGLSVAEMARHGAATQCCGAGGANYWFSVPRRQTMGAARLLQADATGAATVLTECPFCLKMLESSLPQDGRESPRILDLAELVAEAIATPDVRASAP